MNKKLKSWPITAVITLVLCVVLGGMAALFSIQYSILNSALLSVVLTLLVAITTGIVVLLGSRHLKRELDSSKNEAQQANMALQESESHLTSLIKALPDLVWMKDTNGVYVCCNQKIERLLGAKESEIIGKTDYDFFDRELADFFREKDRIAMSAGRPSINEEEVFYADDGHQEVLETIKAPMYGKAGELIGVLGIARDITRRKQDEKALKESELLFRSVFNQTYQFAGIVSLDGTLTSVNQTALNFIGIQESDVIGKPFWETPWWQHSEELKAWIKNSISLAAHGEIIRKEVTHLSRHGLPHRFEFSLKPVVDEDGRVLCLVPESRDITERRNAEIESGSSEVRNRELI